MNTVLKALDAGALLPPCSTPGKAMLGPVVTVNGVEIDERICQNLQTRPASLAARGGHEA